MAGWVTRTLPVTAPNPGKSDRRVPITRNLGEGTTWKSDMLTLIRRQISGIERLTNGVIRVSGTGYPGRSYRLFGTTNLMDWIPVTNTTASLTGTFDLQDISQLRSGLRYYRA